MHPYILLGIIMIIAYILQIIFSLKQIKNFNIAYSRLRKKGKVAIGRRSGKVQSGTIFMFAINSQDEIQDAMLMQGVTVFAKFKTKADYIGENLNQLTSNHPLVTKENKLVQSAILDAKELLIKVRQQDYQENIPVSPIGMLKIQILGYGQQIKGLVKK
ncbi:MAG: transcriptional regulator GutM [Streptococcaceae bacterium]|jgi:DNA-binding transcriptional regulator of glucitol operon|nr:transcriptional regulator GutM [Streptococcaceae bacterium]MCH4177421.1 transcriptional regulator GutM [Streptococcaceae bacterium]